MTTAKRLGILMKKEWADLWSQRIFVIITLGTPFIMFTCFYLIWSMDVTIPLEVVNGAGDRGSRLIHALESAQTPFGTPYLSIETQEAAVVDSRLPGEYTAVLDIPPDFGEKRDGVRVYVPVVRYGAVQENSVKNYINRLHQGEARFLVENHLGFEPIRLVEERQYPVDPPVRQAMAVGVMVMGLLLAGGTFGGVLMAREYEDKTIKLIRVSPANRVLLLSSKGIIAFLLTLTSGIIYHIGAAGLLTGAWQADGFVFWGTTILLSIVGVILGMAVGMLARNSIVVFIVMLIANWAMWITGGGFGSLKLYTSIQQVTARFLPYFHGMSLLWYSYFGGDSALRHHFIILLVIVLAALIFLTYTTKTSLERER